MNRLIGEEQDLREFKDLYKGFYPILIYYARKYVDDTTAEDLVQDIFVKVWQKKFTYFLKKD